MAKRYTRKPTGRRLFLFTCLSIVVLSIGSWALAKSFWPSSEIPKPRYPADVISRSSPTPDEKPPAQALVSTAKGDEPSMLRMPSIDVNAPLQKVGIDQHGEIAVPSNIHVAGWFFDSAKPGKPGLSIIDGHLDGTREKGVFSRLAVVSVGDRFIIERGDKQILTFEVFLIKTVKEADAATILFSQDSATPSQLNLITCSGSFNKKSHNYNDRVIVSARFVNTNY